MSETMFLDQLRRRSKLCSHPNDSFSVNYSNGGDGNIICKDCPFVLSLHAVFLEDFQWEFSINLADYYSQWTHQDDVICSLNTCNLKLRVPTQESYGHLRDIRRALELLRAIHYPFVQPDEIRNTARNEEYDRKLFRMLTDQHQMLIDRLSSCSKDDDARSVMQDPAVLSLVKMLLIMMRDAFSHADLYDIYFKILTPYLKRLKYERNPSFKFLFLSSEFEKSKTKPLGSALSDELIRSSYFSGKLCQICTAFDVVHVMVLCYLFKDDLSVVANLVLDLGSKICRGGYYSFLPDEYAFKSIRRVRELLDRVVTPSHNPKFYDFLQKFRRGGKGLVYSLSEEFFKRYWELKSGVYNHLIDTENDKALEEFVDHRFFLRLLFGRCSDDANYFAFFAALARYATGTKIESRTIEDALLDRETASKDLISECRQIFKFVKSGINKVKGYDKAFTEAYIQNKDDKFDEYYDKLNFKRIVYWTPQMCAIFLETDKVFRSEVIDMSDKLMKFNVFAKADPKFTEPLQPFETSAEELVNPNEVDGSLQRSQAIIDGKEQEQERV